MTGPAAELGHSLPMEVTDYNGEALLLTVKEALEAYGDQTSWQVLMRNGMSKDFSWSASAREYGKVYDRVRQLRSAPATAVKSLVSLSS